ncbi:MAG: glycosyl hydrolase family 28-related protein [Nanoarchaeota archaeon]|nr:glycosyl hydrolase family 28-related protein [Nanoarchaeota archaeon]
MRWIGRFGVLLLFISLFIVSCDSSLPSESEALPDGSSSIVARLVLPQDPDLPGQGDSSPSIAGRAFYAALTEAGYAEPTNVAINKDVLTKGEPLIITVSGEDFVYKHYYISVNGQWQKQTFPDAAIGNSNWIASSASASLSTEQLPEGDNYVIAYSCSETSNGFDCHDNRWQIHQFQVGDKKEEEFPLPVPDPQCGSDQECPLYYVCKDNKCVPKPPQQQPLKEPEPAEFFVGPLAGWKDVKKDYGAVGDGIADDTDKLQAALNDLQQMKYLVLYIPAGTYRITKTLTLPRDAQGWPLEVRIVGEDPATTKIVWDGPQGDSMFFYNPYYGSLARLTFDGKGKAGKIIENGPKFNYFGEYVDVVFQDAGICLEGGNYSREGINSKIFHSTFLRCSIAGVLISNWNSLQWEIYDSYFKDNFVAVTTGNFVPYNAPNVGSNLLQGAGNFHVYQSTFINSTLADIYHGASIFTSIRDSVSIGSNAFYLSTVSSSTGILTLQRNTIIDPQGGVVVGAAGDSCKNSIICIGNRGPLLLLDNVIRTRQNYSGTIVMGGGVPSAIISIGNTYSLNNWFGGFLDIPQFGKGKFRSINDKIVDRSAIADVAPKLPVAPPKKDVPILEVPVGADTAAIQKAINDALQFSGKKPIVHLPAGTYFIDKTLIIPPNADLQLTGDAMVQGTKLVWIGKNNKGPILRIDGPSKASVHELSLDGNKAIGVIDGIMIIGDQPGARIRTSVTTAPYRNKVCYLIDKLQNTAVELLSSSYSGAVGLQVHDSAMVFGTGEAGSSASPGGPPPIPAAGLDVPNYDQDDVTFDIENSNVLIRDNWAESRPWLLPKHVRLKGKTTFTLHSFISDHPRSIRPENVTFLIDAIDGKASFIGGIIGATVIAWPKEEIVPGITVPDSLVEVGDPGLDSAPAILVQGNNPNTKVAVIGASGKGLQYFKSISPVAQVGQIFSYLLQPLENAPEKVVASLDDSGKTDDQFLLDMFEQTRKYGPISYKPTPAGVGDVFLQRVQVDYTQHAFSFIANLCGDGQVTGKEVCDGGSAGKCMYGAQSCQVCSAQCDGITAGKTSYCGDNMCDLLHESTASCAQDCGNACPTNNLVSWWPADGNAKDLISGNDGELKVNAAFTSGEVGQAFSLTSSNDAIDMGDPFDGSLNFGTSDFTIAFWGKSLSPGAVLSKGCPSCEGGVGYAVQAGNDGVYFLVNGAGDTWTTTAVPNDMSQWHHYVGVFNRKSSQLLLYLDGQSKATASLANIVHSVDNNVAFKLGPISNGASVDELMAWRRALTAQEVNNIYGAGSKGMCKP